MKAINRLAKLTPGSLKYMGISQYKDAELRDIDLSCVTELKRWVKGVSTALLKGYGLYLYGNPCSGKSYVAAATLKAVSRRRVGKCRFYTANSLRDTILDFDGRKNNPDVISKYESFRDSEVLIIDSLGSEKVTDFYASELKSILLARRSKERAVTIFTSCISPTPQGKREVVVLYGSETADLIFGTSYPIKVDGDYKNKIMDEMLSFMGK